MSEYLLNCGHFNILVIPDQRSYFLIDESAAARTLLEDFLEGRELNTAGLSSHWFKYSADQEWHFMDGSERRLGRDLDEDDVIGFFVKKKYNFGSLVAVREGERRKLKVFKRARLSVAAEQGV